MELMLSPEIWGAMLVATALTSWVLGDMHGAARIRARDAANEGGIEPHFVRSDAQCPSIQSHSDHKDAVYQDGVAQQRATTEENGTAARHRHRRPRHTVFTDMPPLSELHQQARTIAAADRIWATQGAWEGHEVLASKARTASRELLDHYGRSIEQLRSADDPVFFETDGLQHPSDDPYKARLSG